MHGRIPFASIIKTLTMAVSQLYHRILEARREGRKQLIVLIDPDKIQAGQLEQILDLAGRAGVDYFFVGGSLIVHDGLDACLRTISAHSDIPTILFPGSTYQINDRADAILYLSLISGRNAELLIGQQVVAAPYLKASPLEVISTGYLLIDGGVQTTVSYMSNTQPIPADKNDIAVCTALAGEMLGLKMLYLDAGSGAHRPVSSSMIRAVRRNIDIPLIVGGGIRSPERALAGIHAGADLIVVGNAVEKSPSLILEMADAVHSYRTLAPSDEGQK